MSFRYRFLPRRIAAALLVAALALPASAQNSNAPIPGIDVVVQKQPGGGKMVIPLDAGGQALRRLTLGAGVWRIETACRGGGACSLPGFTGVRVNALRFELPGPGTQLELRLGSVPGNREVSLRLCDTPCNGIGGTGGGRYTIAAERSDGDYTVGDLNPRFRGTDGGGDSGGGDSAPTSGGGGAAGGRP